MLCLELAWPLLAHGPTFSNVTRNHATKHIDYWWACFLLVANIMQFLPGHDIANVVGARRSVN